MPRWLKITLRIAAGCVLLVVLLWLGLAAYINVNKKSVLKTITEQLNDNINGTLTIGSMEPSLIKGFPGISFALKDVTLRDSLWHTHKHDLLKAEYIYVSVNVLSIIQGQPHINDVTIDKGKGYLFTDSTGYSNKSIFGPKKKVDTTNKKKQPEIAKFYFKDVDFVFENNTKFKLFELDIKYAAGLLDYNANGWDANVNADVLIKEFNFNINAGSFLKNKHLVAKIKASYDKAANTITVPKQDILLDEDEILLGIKFFLETKPTSFEVTIKSDGILYKNALSLVSPNIQKNLKKLDLKEPLKLDGFVKGLMKFRDTPLVKISWLVEDNTLILPGAEITNISFTGDYNNEVNPDNGHNDKNSRIHAYGLKGEYMTIPFSADTVQVTNLINPTMEGRFRSKFAITKLGPVLGDRSFNFKDGTADLNLVYRASLNPNDDTTYPYINGYVQIKNAAMTYVPRNLGFTNSSLTLLFKGQDLLLNDMILHSKSTTLNINGSLLNFLNLYYSDPTKIILNMNISSPKVDLNEFRSLISNRAAVPNTAAQNNVQVSKLSRQLDNVLEQSSVHMTVKVGYVIYKKFAANSINAEVTMAQRGITLKNVAVNHADGRVTLNGSMNQGGPINDLDIDANIDNVHIDQFLDAFDNFGQTTISSKNIDGRFFAHAKLKGKIKDNGDLVPRSLYGLLDFNLKDGALVNFAPLVNVGKYIFRKRKLENITFKDIKNKLDIKGDKIYIYPMLIESSALNAKVEGIYAIDKGTDLSIDIPLRNPKKDELLLDGEEKTENQMKGIVIHLRAVDDENGNVKLKLNNKEERALEEQERKDNGEAKPEEKKKRRGLFNRKNK
jgi:hypothetical protein